MSTKRINFKIFNRDEFIAYLENKSIEFKRLKKCTVCGLNVETIEPIHYRIKQRFFELVTEKQRFNLLFKKVPTLEQTCLIEIINERILKMGTRGVYHPKRLKPKWLNTLTDTDKIKLFEKYITNTESSIGFLKLIKVNLCEKTLEAILIEYPSAVSFLTNKNARLICIDKFKRYANGKVYLTRNHVQIDDS